MSELEIIEAYRQKQEKVKMPCPRCGRNTMQSNIYHNALSRAADIHICNACGTSEAIGAMMGYITPLADWYAVQTAK